MGRIHLDHVVLFVNNLRKASDAFKRAHFNVRDGGRHPFGTFNNLIYFADGSYIELVSYEDGMKGLQGRWKMEMETMKSHSSAHDVWPSRLETRWIRDESYQGIVDYAIQTDLNVSSISNIANMSKEDKFKSIEGARKNSEGQEMKWQVSFFHPDLKALPFIIEDRTERDLRVLPVGADEHKNHCSGIHMLKLPVSNLHDTIEQYATYLGMKPIEVGSTFVRYKLGNSFVELHTSIQEAQIVLQRHENEKMHQIEEKLNTPPPDKPINIEGQSKFDFETMEQDDWDEYDVIIHKQITFL